MIADDKAAAAWDDYIDQQQEEKIEELERQLNAANQRIDMLTACNADVARIAKERDDALKRINRLEEFVDQLTNPKFTRDDLPKEALLQRIKRLEQAGDALKTAGYFGGWADAVNKWVKVKEDKA